MSAIILEAEATLRWWRQHHPDEPIPPVAIFLTQLDRPLRFNGLLVAPTESSDCFALTGIGDDQEIVVVRDADVDRIVINTTGPEGIGFAGPVV